MHFCLLRCGAGHFCLLVWSSAVPLVGSTLCSVPNVEENLVSIEAELARLSPVTSNDEHIVVLPECCLFFGGKDAEQLAVSKRSLKDKLATLAKKYQVLLVAGSIPLATSAKIEDKFAKHDAKRATSNTVSMSAKRRQSIQSGHEVTEDNWDSDDLDF